MNKMWHIIVEIRKRNAILRAYGLSYYNFVDVIKFVPILVTVDKKELLKNSHLFTVDELTQHCGL